MKRFRFIGDPSEYSHKVELNEVYEGNLYIKKWGRYVEETACLYPNDWKEIQETDVDPSYFENNQFDYTKISTGILPQIPNQDKPASEITKFEMAVFMAIQGLTANPELLANSHEDHAEKAIEQATETFKQLENLKK